MMVLLPNLAFKTDIINVTYPIILPIRERDVPIRSIPAAADDQSELTMSVLMTPDMANFSGNVHGGTILKLLDQVAYACASRFSGSYVVTLSVDKVNFKEPIHVGELVTFLASVQPCRSYFDGNWYSC